VMARLTAPENAVDPSPRCGTHHCLRRPHRQSWPRSEAPGSLAE
jgi:hypothetical protein